MVLGCRVFARAVRRMVGDYFPSQPQDTAWFRGFRLRA